MGMLIVFKYWLINNIEKFMLKNIVIYKSCGVKFFIVKIDINSKNYV